MGIKPQTTFHSLTSKSPQWPMCHLLTTGCSSITLCYCTIIKVWAVWVFLVCVFFTCLTFLTMYRCTLVGVYFFEHSIKHKIKLFFLALPSDNTRLISFICVASCHSCFTYLFSLQTSKQNQILMMTHSDDFF